MIVSELIGGLGNQMFQYAIGRHLAIKNKTDLFLDINFLLDRTPRPMFVHRDYDLSIFNINEKFIGPEISRNYGLCRTPIKKYIQKIIPSGKLKYISEKKFSFNSNVLNSADDIYLNGYWQTEKYFAAIEEVIRLDFTFKDKIGENTKELVQKISTCNAICLHVRRKDFVTNPTHGTLELEYYLTAERKILETIDNPVFFIFSDEIEWCKKNITLSSEMHFVGDEFAGRKNRDCFELMTMCKHFIIPNSSFGWWAAWLSKNTDKIVIVPKIWFHNSNWDTRDLIPDKWIKI